MTAREPAQEPERTLQLPPSVVLIVRPSAKWKSPRAKVKLAPGKPAGAAQLALMKLRKDDAGNQAPQVK